MVARDAGGREHVTEERERTLPPQAVVGDGLAGGGGQLGGAARRIERGRRHADAVDHVVEDPVGQPLGVVVEAVQCSLAHVVNPSPFRGPRDDDGAGHDRDELGELRVAEAHGLDQESEPREALVDAGDRARC